MWLPLQLSVNREFSNLALPGKNPVTHVPSVLQPMSVKRHMNLFPSVILTIIVFSFVLFCFVENLTHRSQKYNHRYVQLSSLPRCSIIAMARHCFRIKNWSQVSTKVMPLAHEGRGKLGHERKKNM